MNRIDALTSHTATFTDSFALLRITSAAPEQGIERESAPQSSVQQVVDALIQPEVGLAPVVELIMAYDLPECALQLAQRQITEFPQNADFRAQLGALYMIHNLFDRAILAFLSADNLHNTIISMQMADLKSTYAYGMRVRIEKLQDQQDRHHKLMLERLASIKKIKTEPAARAHLALDNIKHYHADAALHGDDDTTLFRCISHLEKSVTWSWSERYVRPFFMTPRAMLRIQIVDQTYQSSYIQALFAQVFGHFPKPNPFVRKDLPAALHHIRAACAIGSTPGAHFVAAHILRELALLQVDHRYQLLYITIATFHDRQRRVLMHPRAPAAIK